MGESKTGKETGSQRTHRVFSMSSFLNITFAKYIFSALSSCLIDILLFGYFCRLFDQIDLFRHGELYVSVSTIAARVISATYNYLMNYRVVFRSDASRVRSLSKYALLAVMQMCLSALFVTIFHSIFGGNEMLVKLPVDTLLFFVSYIVQREIVYK